MAADMIENYEGHPAFRFFRDFDADCDWSEALAGEPGEYVAIVRKAKDKYFLGAATDEEARSIDVKLDFLEKEKLMPPLSMPTEKMPIGRPIRNLTKS